LWIRVAGVGACPPAPVALAARIGSFVAADRGLTPPVDLFPAPARPLQWYKPCSPAP
jgi:hypothetical protein